MSRVLIKREQQPKRLTPFRPEGTEGVDYKLIWLNPRVAAVVDCEMFEILSQHHWRLKRSGNCYYASRKVYGKGITWWLKMHRDIMNTPSGYDCHHKNRHTLDNRKSNLENLTQDEHASRHLELI